MTGDLRIKLAGIGLCALIASCSTGDVGVATNVATNFAPISAASSADTKGLPGYSSNPSSANPSSAAGASDPQPSSVADASYPTTPAPLPPTAGSEAAGRIAEGARLAAYVLVPTFVFPEMTASAALSTTILKNPDALAILVPRATPQVAAKHGMIAGFSSARKTVADSSGRSDSVINAVLSFATPAAAVVAATDLNASIGIAKGADSADVVLLNGFNAAVTARVAAEATSKSVDVFVARGSVVNYVWASSSGGSSPDSIELLAQKVASMLTAQLPISEVFVPTQLVDLAGIPADREGLLAHTVLGSSEGGSVNKNQVFDFQGMKHFFVNPLDDEEALTAAGVDLVSRGVTTMYRAADPAGALVVQAAFWSEYGTYYPAAPEYEGPTDVPGVQCAGSAGTFFVCVFSRGRYAVEAAAETVEDVTAQVRAQYALLAGF
ncbi:hypothetical protein EH165_11860 [Nakamurella antarctica]|uniref:Uncharacterized protein n=1 Tax=Nakamurella antarctica TaxID=1902245 RepID=A0A3G8ZPJ8_9ACTN|nr:hypothetical protein [Nakamurella antarctica]AZI58725.1 hypothetical protein EH165_11860 [Nakamurella antarctica]